MRDIKFRGKRVDNNEWIYGQLLYFKSTVGNGVLSLIIKACEWTNSDEWFNLGERAKVDENTIGQYTGLKDKNGKEIYEGDIVYISLDDENATIIWDSDSARYIIQFEDRCSDFDSYLGEDLEIIGNI